MKTKIKNSHRKWGKFPGLMVTILVLCAFIEPINAEYSLSTGASTMIGVKKGKVIGKVITGDATPLEGVTVAITGTALKTVTDFQGTFILKGVPRDAELSLSFVGLKTLRIKPDFDQLLTLKMEIATFELPKTIVRPEEETTTLFVASDEFGVRVKGILDNKPPLFVLDGKEIPKSEFNTLNADHIDKIGLLKDSTEIKKYGDKGKNGVIIITSKKIVSTPATVRKLDDIMVSVDEVRKEKKFAIPEQMPQFPGGETRMKYYFSTYTKYPKQAKTEKVEGTVLVSFVVGKTGKVDKVTIIKGAHPALNAEASRVVSSMTYWTPGIQNDIPVEVHYTVPIEFSLQPDNK